MNLLLQEDLERPSEGFDSIFLRNAREKTMEVCAEIPKLLKAGMTERDAKRVVMECFAERGVKKHWHRTYVRFGAGTCRTFNEPEETEETLKENDPVYFDVGPIWPKEVLGSVGELDYEGDYGNSFVFLGNRAPPVLEFGRELFEHGRSRWITGQVTGAQLYVELSQLALKSGYSLHPRVRGHRLSDFPHQKYTKATLGELPFVPGDGRWVLEVHLIDPQLNRGAFFEDLLLKDFQ